MAITLSDDEASNHESSSDKDGNFITFTTTTLVDENVMVDENPSDGELFESADLQKKLIIRFARLLQRML